MCLSKQIYISRYFILLCYMCWVTCSSMRINTSFRMFDFQGSKFLVLRPPLRIYRNNLTTRWYFHCVNQQLSKSILSSYSSWISICMRYLNTDDIFIIILILDTWHCLSSVITLQQHVVTPHMPAVHKRLLIAYHLYGCALSTAQYVSIYFVRNYVLLWHDTIR